MAGPAEATSPTGTLEAFFTRANTILQSVRPFQDLDGSRQAIRALVNQAFDFRGAAAVALGSVWLSRVPEDQDAFARLFAVFLERGFIATIGSKASVAGGVTIHYLKESIDGESAAVATTLLTRSGQELSVVYRMVHRGDDWKVQDVIIDGVSLVLNYRAQFTRILAASPYTELVARMQRETASEPPPAESLPTQSSSLVPQPEMSQSNGGTRGGTPSGDPSRVGAIASTAPTDAQRRADVVGRLLVRSRSDAEREVSSVLAKAGGTALSREHGPLLTVIKGVVPQSGYGKLTTALRGIGAWQLEIERFPLPNLVYVTFGLTE